MSTKIITNIDKTLILANKFKPVIYQEYKSIKDAITPIMLCNEADMMTMLPIIEKDPCLYFLIREDFHFYYAFYMIFHPFDWSTFPIPFIRKWLCHLYDTESILFRVSKCNKCNIVDVATVHHNSFLFQAHTQFKVVIESESHAIHPYELKLNDITVNLHKYRVYFDYRLKNLNDITPKQWRTIKKQLHGVNTPQEQYDEIWIRSTFGIRHQKGDMFFRPDVLFSKAIETRRMKNA